MTERLFFHSAGIVPPRRERPTDRTPQINERGLDILRRALRCAEDEIHNPGCGLVNGYDVLDLIEQAKGVLRSVTFGDAR
jgi:hypothetical protein